MPPNQFINILLVVPPVGGVGEALVEDVGRVESVAEELAGLRGREGRHRPQAQVQNAQQVGRLAAVPQQLAVCVDLEKRSV